MDPVTPTVPQDNASNNQPIPQDNAPNNQPLSQEEVDRKFNDSFNEQLNNMSDDEMMDALMNTKDTVNKARELTINGISNQLSQSDIVNHALNEAANKQHLPNTTEDVKIDSDNIVTISDDTDVASDSNKENTQQTEQSTDNKVDSQSTISLDELRKLGINSVEDANNLINSWKKLKIEKSKLEQFPLEKEEADFIKKTGLLEDKEMLSALIGASNGDTKALKYLLHKNNVSLDELVSDDENPEDISIEPVLIETQNDAQKELDSFISSAEANDIPMELIADGLLEEWSQDESMMVLLSAPEQQKNILIQQMKDGTFQKASKLIATLSDRDFTNEFDGLPRYRQYELATYELNKQNGLYNSSSNGQQQQNVDMKQDENANINGADNVSGKTPEQDIPISTLIEMNEKINKDTTRANHANVASVNTNDGASVQTSTVSEDTMSDDELAQYYNDIRMGKIRF